MPQPIDFRFTKCMGTFFEEEKCNFMDCIRLLGSQFSVALALSDMDEEEVREVLSFVYSTVFETRRANPGRGGRGE